jgi:hypothetical protein
MDTIPPPRTTELVGWLERVITMIDSDTVPRYAGYPSHTWVKVGALADSVAFRNALDTAIAQYDDRFYYPPMSNIFTSTILKRSGVALTKNQFRALGKAPGLCRCYEIFMGLGNIYCPYEDN